MGGWSRYQHSIESILHDRDCSWFVVYGRPANGDLRGTQTRDTLALLHHEANDIAHQFDQRLRATKRLPPDAVYAIKAWRDL
jgi:hypothetical protein